MRDEKRSGTLLRLFGGGRLFAAIILALSGLSASDVRAADASVAVAANFTDAAKEIGAAFQKATDHRAVFSCGTTGQFYTQITQEAPFEVFLAADQQGPEKAVAEGLAVPGTSFTYATGRIVLFSKDQGLVAGERTLRDGRFTRLAIANPATAPYGAAAIEAMKALGVYQTLSAKLVQGNNISQTYQFVETGNADPLCQPPYVRSGKARGPGPLADLQADPSLPLLGAPDAAVVLEGRISAFDDTYRLTAFAVAGGELLIPGRHGRVNDRLRLRISASDVSVALAQPAGTTILNCLPARIISAAEASGCEAQINVIAALGEAGRGNRVVARITRKSRDALGLTPGNRVFVQIKSVALLASGPDAMPTDAR